MRVALTGGAGFVGRHVLAELLRRGCEVSVLQRPRTPGETSQSPASAGECAAALRTVRGDLADPSPTLFDALGRPELLIHLAWGGLPNYNSLHHFEQELPLHYRWLRALLDAGLPRLLVSGTCFEYGMQSGALAEDLPARPTNPYGYAKDALRRQLEFLQAQRPFALSWARLFYLHGEGQSEASLLPLLRSAVARGDASFPMSGGEQLRDYLPVTEAARCLVDLALAGCAQGIVNVCSGRPVSVRRLVEAWVADAGWPIRLDLGRYPYPTYEPLAFWGDRSKLDACLARSAGHPVPT